jgi:putative addiction module CopG family antidote
MVEFQLQFPQPLGDYIQDQIVSGRYPGVSEYLRDLVRADQQQQHIVEQLHDNEHLAKYIDEGLSSSKGRQWTPAVLQELRQQVLNRSQKESGNG